MRLDFGFNSNIWQTNLLNLSVVIGIVVRVLGDVVKQVLADRRRTIIERRKSANTLWTEALSNLEHYVESATSIDKDGAARGAGSTPRVMERPTPDQIEAVSKEYFHYAQRARRCLLSTTAETPLATPRRARDPILAQHSVGFVRQLGSEIIRLEAEYDSKVNREYNLKIRSFRIIEQSVNHAKSQLSELAGTRK
jgi:hypothetical protein